MSKIIANQVKKLVRKILKVNAFFERSRSLSSLLRPVSVLALPHSETCAGKITKTSKREATKTMIAIIGTIRMNCPETPDINIKGPNAPIVVKLAATTGQPTSSAPRIAATFGDAPFSICRYVFSMTTIASSTTIPTTRISPKSATPLIV